MSPPNPLKTLLADGVLDQFELVAEERPPPTAVGRGLVRAAQRPRLTPDTPPAFDVVSLRQVGAPVLQRWGGDPSVFVLETEEPPTFLAGDPYVHEPGVYELDSAAEPFAVLLRVAGRESLLGVHDGAVWEYARIAAEARLRGPEFPDPSPRAEYPDLDLDGIGDQAEPWLMARAKVLAARVDGPPVAVGLLLRLGHPATPEARARRLDRLRSGSPSPVRVWAIAWLEGLSDADLIDLEGRSRAAVLRLLDLLDDLTEAVSEGQGSSAALAAVEERDALESIARVLTLVGRAAELRAALRALDDRCGVLGTSLGDALADADGDADWLGAVSWREPESWWGALASAQ